MTDPLIRRLEAMDWPAPPMDCPTPQRGQLWRAAWAGSAGLVVIADAARGREVPVMAATADRVGDDATIVADTSNGIRVSVWAGMQADIMMFTLDHRLGDLTAASLAALTVAADGTHLAEWAPITSDLDDRILVRVDLQEMIQAFAAAEWVPAVDEHAPTLGQLAETHDVTASQIAARLGITPGAARRLLQAKAEPTDSQRTALLELIGSIPQSNLRPPDDLVAALDSPHYRPRLQLIANRDHHGNETAARRASAQRAMAMAARHRRSRQRDWAELTRQALDAD